MKLVIGTIMDIKEGTVTGVMVKTTKFISSKLIFIINRHSLLYN